MGYKKNDHLAEGTGVEPVRACAHWFSRPTHYRPAHLPDNLVYKRWGQDSNLREPFGSEI